MRVGGCARARECQAKKLRVAKFRYSQTAIDAYCRATLRLADVAITAMISLLRVVAAAIALLVVCCYSRAAPLHTNIDGGELDDQVSKTKDTRQNVSPLLLAAFFGSLFDRQTRN